MKKLQIKGTQTWQQCKNCQHCVFVKNSNSSATPEPVAIEFGCKVWTLSGDNDIALDTFQQSFPQIKIWQDFRIFCGLFVANYFFRF